ncbi:non-ribosomal peptide synthetase [Paenibacillus piri]|uniref:Amino acid adenylation domain-containing protein n=1 Tax=Paenibacillus piri TaxID=2547395 RepID=A0A4R5KDL6_9BACL|nr:non-ribosomal peptide synthetase [Paenibacillus piri]TDF92725.1 amino acid adenylation domain-containing protein [Paenibacillus piri]
MSQATIQKVYPLTPMQEGMMYHAMLDPESSAYFTQLELAISGQLDIDILQKSLDQLIRSYDILRTVFVHQQLQRPRQVVFAERQANVHFDNITNMPPVQQQLRLENYKRENRTKGFHLGKELLFRVAVFQLADGTFHLIWSNHHILIDGWSLGILMKKLFQYYEALRGGETLTVEPARPYGDYIKWLEKQDKEEALAYWEKRLTQFEQPTSLPQRKRPSAGEGYRNAEFTFVWDDQLVASIRQTANRYQVTASNLFQAVWGALLARYNNTEDAVFGTVVSGRPSAIEGIENMVGLFINTIPTRLQMGQGTTFAELFAVMQQRALEAERYDYVPLYEIQNRSSLNQQLIDHLLAFENFPLDRELENGQLEQRLGFSVQVAGALEQTNYDFNLIAFPGDRWTVKMMYNASVYERQWIEKVAGHLTRMMHAAVRKPETEISRANFISEEEQAQLLDTFNDTEADYPQEKTIHQLFEEQAERLPDRTAVVFDDRQITYRELNAKANRLAAVLRAKGVGSDDIVGIMAERSIEMVIGMLAIIKSGGAYLPIDPAYPTDRIRFMLEDSGTDFLLTHKQLMGLVEFSGETLDLDLDPREAGNAGQEAANLEPVCSPDNLAYIIYTSGTTGKPKGVMISHRNVVRLLYNDKLQFTFSENDVWTMFHSFCFDFSVWEMYGALLYGGKLVVVPKHIAQSPHEFRDLLIREQVTVLSQTPTAFAQLIQRELTEPGKQLGIRYAVFGGEALKPVMLKEWHAKYPETRLINMYGITETTVHVTFKEIGEQEIDSNVSNIGVPIPTLGCYIMDKHLNLMPAGVVGELCVSGLGVARGYLHRPELTAERFFVNPYKPEERLYRSGDLARLLPNGEMEYFGRMDHQVKIRGFRIELGEIESRLLQLKHVSEAAVLARNDKHGHPMLCAYFVAREALSVSELRKSLSASLPDYMVPAHLMQLKEMPVTSNGKLDLKLLPEPEARTDTESFREPEGEMERRLAAIWQDVLGVTRIGAEDDFFSLGGHSLKAMMLTSKIHQQLERYVPIKILFECPTIRQLAGYMQYAEEDTAAAIVPVPARPHYPVSSAQRRMYVLSQLEGAGSSYNMPAVLLLEGELDMPRLEAAFRSLVDRHETLRTSFDMVEGELVQTIDEDVRFQLQRSARSEREAETLIRKFVRPFDLRQAPLLRAELIRFSERRHLLLIDMHHIISDGVSSGILVHDLSQLYRGESLPEPKLHYKDYAVWQNSREQQEHTNRLEAFWLDTFAGELPVLELPGDHPRPAERSFAGERLSFGLSAELSQQMYRLMEETGVTMYMVLLTVFNVFLSKCSAQEDIIVGSPVAGRTHAAIRDIPGMFVNTLALRSAPKGDKTFKQLLLEVKDVCLQAFAHQDYPFEELVEKLPLNRDTNRSPLFNVMFNLQNMDIPQLQLGDLSVSPYPLLPPPAAKFDLTLEAVERNGAIDLSFDYATALFTPETIGRWSGHLLQIAETAIYNPEIRLAELEMITPEERKHLLEPFGETRVSYPIDRTIQSCFEEQASKMPDRVAVVAEQESLTYRELDEKANRLAGELRSRGIGREDAVALLLDRSIDTIVAMLAVLKAGGAYLPIDPENPDQRLQFIFQDSGARCLIAHERHAARASALYSGEIINIDLTPPTGSPDRQAPVNESGDLAYMMYTSGTTGKPKGVMIEHRQVLHLIEALRGQVYSLYDYTVLNVALLAPFHFDASVQQIFASLLLGHTLFIVPGSSTVDGHALAAYYRSRRIDVTDGTPAHLQMLLAAGSLQGVDIRHMLIGGEALPYETVRQLLDLFTRSATAPAITNVYGPTECCVDASAYDIVPPLSAGDRSGSFVPIGRPLGNNRLYILDAYGKLQPTGIPGELCIAGDGVGRGYLNLPELTAERFAADPFVPGESMYRTGDLVCRRADGVIEFVGRMDNQVKIRGYRIELGEIESALLNHKQVTQAAVIGKSEKGTMEQLCAYFVANAVLDAAELRVWLSGQLPKYMVPSSIVQLESILLASNGKIDRRALPETEPDMTMAGREYAAPTSEIEQQLCALWQETLGIERVGVDDNFFELGGHSLKAMTLIGSMQTKLKRDIPLKILFEQPTVRQLALYLQLPGGTDLPLAGAIKPAAKREYYPLSPAQKRMYIVHQLDGTGISCNMPSALVMEGEPDIAHLQLAFKQLVERHESLRTTFTEVNDVPVQMVHEHVDFQCKVTAGEKDEAAQLIRRFVRPFDLSTGPLIRAEIVRMAENRYLLLIDMHHIIADGVSTGILIKQLADLYEARDLPAPKLHFKDFTVWLSEPEQQESIRGQELFWLEQFAGDIPALQLPCDFPRPALQSFAGGRIRFDADLETALKIRSLATETGVTLHMLLLAVFNVFLARMSGQHDIVVGTAVAGRRHADLQDVPGMFVNTLALRSSPEPDKTFRQFLQEVKETGLLALEHQDYPFEELVGRLDLPRDISRNPLFNVMLTLENPDSEPLRLDGLSLSPYELPDTVSKFDLTLAAFENEGAIGLQLEYCCELFAKQTIVRWSGYILNIMRYIADRPDSRLAEIELMSAEEKQRIVADWNQTALSVPHDRTMHELFEDQVRRTPDRPAVAYKGRHWTYRELNARANRLAHLLMGKGIGPEQRVGIMVRPSLEMAAGVLAILKAGGAFVPFDPDYPEQRIAYMLSDSGAPILLTQSDLPVPESFGGEVILLDGEHAMQADRPGFDDETNPIAAIGPRHLAYIIYTSGTTGQPKGVMIEHHSLVNLSYWHNEAFAVTDQDSSAKYAGFGFDASVWEMFPYWIAGAEVHIIDEAIRMDIARLNEYFEHNRITVTFLPTQLCEQFLELDNRSLRILLTGGDKLKRTAERRYTLVNNYGPTESTVVASSTPILPGAGTLSIGRPIANTRLYIVAGAGADTRLQPVGAAGELCIGGRGLARGYNNRPRETAEKFVADPFMPGERMYRTGDLARWLDDGTIEYIGRIDQQVKVRGFRIELSEIEMQLARIMPVKAAAVKDIEENDGSTALCAYIVAEKALNAGQLQQELSRKLPDYMMPRYWVMLDELPLTPNGKVDKKALPEPDIAASAAEYKAPESETQQQLVDIWQDVLGIPQIGIRDNFFARGGDSIKGIQMASRLRKLGWKLDMKDLFQHPTIEQVSPYLQYVQGKQTDQGPIEGEVKLTPIQRRFFEQRFTDMHHWNQSIMLHAPAGFDPQTVAHTIIKMMEHHDALRMVYAANGEGYAQYNRGPAFVQSVGDGIEIIDFRGVSDVERRIADHANHMQKTIDLDKGPLLKTALFQTGQGDHLLIIIHHLVVDGVSWRILLEDFASGYEQAAQGRSIVFQDKTDSFKQWAEQLESYANSQLFLKQSEYWRQLEAEPVMPLPKDNAVDLTKMKDNAVLSFDLTPEATRLLLTDVHRAYGTEINDILLCALGLAVGKWTGHSKLCLNLEGHGREEIIPGMNVSRTVGWFTAQYPVVLEIKPDAPLPNLIKTTKESLRGIPHKGIGYGILRYLTASEHTDGLAFPLQPEISFNYLGQFDREVSTDLFGASPYGMGHQISPEAESLYPLNFTGIVHNGRLVVSCSFNKLQYLRGTINRLMDRFQHQLLQIIDHCASKEDREVTPSDFSAGSLRMDEMEDLFDVLANKLG